MALPDTTLTASSPGRGYKHAELTRALRLLASSLNPGDRFPSQNELMRRYGVSDRTVLRSLEDLRRDGVIVRRTGSGTFISSPGEEAFGGGPPPPHAAVAPAMGTLAVVALNKGAFFRHCVDELTAQAGDRNLAVVCQYANNVPEIHSVLCLEALAPAGFLVFSSQLLPVAKGLRQRGHRVVLVGVLPPDGTPELPGVCGDHETGAALVVRHLVGRGHRRITYLQIKGELADRQVSLRWRGHVRALREAGIDPEAQLDLGAEDLLEARRDPASLRRKLSGPDAPTALVAWTDEEAVVWRSALREAGLRVPDDVSLVGYDNVPVGAHADPPLDTVDPHLDIQMRHALDLLTATGPPSGVSTPFVSVTPTLLVRASSRPV